MHLGNEFSASYHSYFASSKVLGNWLCSLELKIIQGYFWMMNFRRSNEKHMMGARNRKRRHLCPYVNNSR
jgi:hypothetical protein